MTKPNFEERIQALCDAIVKEALTAARAQALEEYEVWLQKHCPDPITHYWLKRFTQDNT